MLRRGLAALALAAPVAGMAQEAPAPAPKTMLVEIYRIAPGQHENFMKLIAQFHEANRRAGLPPRQLYVHQDGASWDFMFIQPADVPDDRLAALREAHKALGTPSGPDFFTKIRSFVAEHSDTFASGPTSAADWLRALGESRSKPRN